MFVARLSSAGKWLTVIQPYATSAINPTALVVDTNGDLVIGGSFSSSRVQFGTTELYNSDYSSRDIFIARLSKITTTPTWTQAVRAGGPDFDNLTQLALDGQGNAVITGKFYGATTRFGDITLTKSSQLNNNTGDVLVARLSRAGVWTQALQAGGTLDDSGYGVTTDATGSTVLVAGTVTTPATFGSLTLPAATASATSGFIARLGGLPLLTRQSADAGALTIFPNPAQTRATLVLASAAPAPCTAQVVDALGQVVRQQQVAAGVTAVELPLAGLSAGLYLVRCGEANKALLVE